VATDDERHTVTVSARSLERSARAPSRRDAGARRIGRPPKVKGEETRDRLIELARRVFADRGYEVTTNKELADAAGFTPAALYYHFPSKKDLYLAVWAETQQRIYERFEADTAAGTTFRERFDLLMDSAHNMNAEDPSLARFVAAVRVDQRRHPELFEGHQRSEIVRQSFFDKLVNFGVRTGEIAKSDRVMVRGTLLSFLIGLNDAMSDDEHLHSEAIDGMRALLDGGLLRPPSKAPAARARRAP
jgi:AcrR family transcriptional regulator